MFTRHVRRLVLEFVAGLPLFPGRVRSIILRACKFSMATFSSLVPSTATMTDGPAA